MWVRYQLRNLHAALIAWKHECPSQAPNRAAYEAKQAEREAALAAEAAAASSPPRWGGGLLQAAAGLFMGR
eukprot:1602197-Rhodomonas_salina.1